MQHEFPDDEQQTLHSYVPQARQPVLELADQVRASRTVPQRNVIDAAFVRWVINARAVRRKFFESNLFADPAWDMLLELFALECDGRRISVSKLSVAASVPCTTTLRWIEKLESESLVVRTADPLDARRVWVGLSDLGLRTMRAYTEQVMAVGLPI